jgi:hypothetical protein
MSEKANPQSEKWRLIFICKYCWLKATQARAVGITTFHPERCENCGEMKPAILENTNFFKGKAPPFPATARNPLEKLKEQEAELMQQLNLSK